MNKTKCISSSSAFSSGERYHKYISKQTFKSNGVKCYVEKNIARLKGERECLGLLLFSRLVMSNSFVGHRHEPTDCSPPGSSVHGISQARILEWVPFPSPGDLPTSPALAGGLFAAEPAGKPNKMLHTFILKTGWNSFRVDNNLI